MKALIAAVATITLVVALSILSVQLWGEKEEVFTPDVPLAISAQMTVGEFAQSNHLARPLLKDIFSLRSEEQLQQPLGSFGLSLEEIVAQVHQKRALAEEESSKNWFKIPLKFVLWFVFMGMSFVLLRRKKITRKTRMILYAGSFALFGVVLGADPSPMGTVKDAIVLYGAKGVVFKPRLVAFGVFTLTVVLANKFICSWGCQLGTLQDFIFRLNRNRSDAASGALPQVKVPFVISNTIRVLFFVALIWVAFAWAYDITHEIDPFKIFKPLKLSVWGWSFVLTLLVGSLFVYRPWCHFFCPFGLTGWLFEKLSLYKIKVDYEACISCSACEKACPSSVMGAILHQDKAVIPDCFSCGNCLDACPTDAVSFSRGRRAKPPVASSQDEASR
jgi:NAD-dependent dihydropyrimidine dehydrogenase PreA subunit